MAPTSTGEIMTAKNAAILFGVVFLLVGVLGYVPNPIVGPAGIFATNSLHNVIHLLSGIALLAVTILWLGIYRPIDGALSAARARHADAVVRLGETRAKVAALKGLPRAGGAPAGPLATVMVAV